MDAVPTLERITSILIRLLEDQENAKITYQITYDDETVGGENTA